MGGLQNMRLLFSHSLTNLLAIALFYGLNLESASRYEKWFNENLVFALEQGSVKEAKQAIQDGANVTKVWENILNNAAFAFAVRSTTPDLFLYRHQFFCSTLKTALLVEMIPENKYLLLPILTFQEDVYEPYLKTRTINIDCGKKMTLLHHAVSTNSLEAVKIVVKYGANIYAKNSSGEKPQDIDGTDQYIKKYLNFVADFYAANGNLNRSFSNFNEKYLSIKNKNLANKHIIDTFDLAHLGEKKFVDDFYYWLKENKKIPWLKTQKNITRPLDDIGWFYLDLAQREAGNFYKQYSWFKEVFSRCATKKNFFEKSVDSTIKKRISGNKELLTACRNQEIQKKQILELVHTDLSVITKKIAAAQYIDMRIFFTGNRVTKKHKGQQRKEIT